MKLRIINNPLDYKNQEITELEYQQGKILREYLKDYKLEDYKVIVSGKVVTDFDLVLKEYDEIILVPKVEDVIGFVAVIWKAVAAWWAKATFWKAVMGWTMFALAAYSVVQAVIMGRRRPPQRTGDVLEDSPTYGWDGIRDTQDVNIPKPIIYGEHRVGGNRLNVWVESQVQYDWVWKDITPTNVVNSGYVNTFRTPVVRGFSFGLKQITYRIQKEIGKGIPYINLFNVLGIFMGLALGYTYGRLSYKVEYKKSTDTDYILYGDNIGVGLAILYPFVQWPPMPTISLPDLPEAQYDIRITANVTNISDIPQNTAYYEKLQGKVGVPSTSQVDKQYLNILFGICEGEIDSISDILVNDQPIENFNTEGIRPEVYIRTGLNDEDVIPHFGDLHNLYDINVELKKNQFHKYTTYDSDVESFILSFSLPQGLYSVNSSDGSMGSWSVTYKVEYSIAGAENWVDLGNFTITKKNRTTVRFQFRKDGLAKNRYDIKVTKISDDSSMYLIGDLFLLRIDEIKLDDLIYPNLAKVGIRFLAYEQLSGSLPNVTFLVRGTKVKQPKIVCGGAELNHNEYYYDNGYKRLSDGADASWDGESWVTKWSANPIWCMYNLLVNKRYGLGRFIDVTNLDVDLFVEMANYSKEMAESGIEPGIKEERFRMDVVLDSRQRALDWISRLCSTFRAVGFYTEGLVKIVINKPETPSQLFGMGNIIEGSFSESFAELGDIPNSLEIDFMDKNKDYRMETIGVEDEEALAQGEPLRSHRYSKIGVTRISQVIRDAKYELRCLKYLTRQIGFGAGIDAIACTSFDVIDFAHDVPQWSVKSGRVKSGTNDPATITIDEPVTLEEGKTYRIRVRHNIDDSFEEKEIINDEPGTYMVLEVDSNWSVLPVDYDVYVIGIENIVVKPFRIVNMRRRAGGEAELIALEYNEAIFEDSTFKLPISNYSLLSIDIPYVMNLKLTEGIVKLADGTIEDFIDVWFSLPDTLSHYIKRYLKAKIYLSDNNGESWEYRGETFSDSFRILGGLSDGVTYKVAVTSVSDSGEETTISNSPQATITVVGKQAPPANVTGFDVYQQSNMLYLTCDIHPDIDFAYFRIKQGTDWNYGKKIIERADLNKFPYPVGEIGAITFMIKAVDTSENESADATYDTLIVVPPPEMSFINAFDLWSMPLEYKRNNMDLIWDNRHDKNFNRVMLALKTAKTWEDLEAEAQTWEWQEENDGLILDKEFESSGYFEMVKPIDLEIKFPFKIIIDVSYWAGLNCTLTIQISISDDDIDYTDFETINANKLYTARYIKFKVIISNTNIAYNLYLYDMTIWVNALQVKKAWGQDIAIPIEGKIIVFGVDFTLPPRFMAIVSNGIAGYVSWAKEDLTKDQNKVYVKNFAGSPIGDGEVNYEASGM